MKPLKATILLLIIVIVSCSSPVDKIYSKEGFKEDLPELKKELSSDEIELLAATIVRFALIDESKLNIMSYKELLQEGVAFKVEQDSIQAAQKALAEELKAERDAKMKKLREATMVTCFEKGFTTYNYQDYITYKFGIQNNSDKDIRALTGRLIFNDLFDKEVSVINFTYDEPVKSGTRVVWEATTDYNQFQSDDVTLKNKDLDNLKLVWEPEKIIFSDGSELSM